MVYVVGKNWLIFKEKEKLNNIYQYPFLYFYTWGIKPSLVILGLFLLGLIGFYIYGKKKKRFTFVLKFDNMTAGQKNQLVLCIWGYLLLILIYFFQDISSNTSSTLIDIFENYLKYEFFISFAILLSLIYGCLIKENKDKYLNLIINVSIFILYFSIFSTLLTKQIDLFEWENLFWYAILGFVFIVLILIEVKAIIEQDIRQNIFQPIVKFDELFGARKEQAVEMLRMINDSSEKTFSICVSGEWGIGKTSFVNGVLDKLQEEKEEMRIPYKKLSNKLKKRNSEYKIIRINALEIDTIQSLFTYFFSQIKQYLKDKGAYVGIFSEYESFVAASFGIITNKTFGNLVSKKIFQTNDDYRQKKKELETLISEIMGDGRIIVVLDDIERCDQKKAREFIFFIKEIATIGNCISIFITDYNQLVGKGKSELNEIDYIFFDKFFNYRINLGTVLFEDSMKHFEKQRCFIESIENFVFTTPKIMVEKIEYIIQIKIDETKKRLQNLKGDKEVFQSEIDTLNQISTNIIKSIQHPRKLVKFYTNFYKYCNIIQEEYFENTKDEDVQQVVSYLEKINISELLFFLSFIESCTPIQFEKIKSIGVWGFIGQLNEEDKIDTNNKQLADFLFKTIINEIIIEPKFGYGNEKYIQVDKNKFIDAILNKKNELKNLVNKYTSEEEEWFAAIEEDKIDSFADQWVNVGNAILRSFAFSISECEKGKEYLEKILDFVYKKVENNEWNDDEPFKLFNHDYQNEYMFCENIYIMEYFYKLFFSTTRNWSVSSETKNRLKLFSIQFITHHLKRIINLLYFWCEDEKDEKIIVGAKEKMYTYRKDVVERMEIFISDVSILKKFDGDDVFSKLNNLADETEKILKKYNCLKFEDVKNDIQKMRKSIEDIRYFTFIIKKVDKDLENILRFDLKEINLENIRPQIEYFENRFLNMEGYSSNNWHEVSQEFSDFFQYIWINKDKIKVEIEEISRLDTLVTHFFKKSNNSAIFYRKVLFDLKVLYRIK